MTEDGQTVVPEDVVRDVGEAFNTVGFIYAVDHGLSYGELLRQFAIGQYLLNGVSDEDKEKYRCKIEEGSFVGYKTQGRWKLDGVQDRIEVRLPGLTGSRHSTDFEHSCLTHSNAISAASRSSQKRQRRHSHLRSKL